MQLSGKQRQPNYGFSVNTMALEGSSSTLPALGQHKQSSNPNPKLLSIVTSTSTLIPISFQKPRPKVYRSFVRSNLPAPSLTAKERDWLNIRRALKPPK